MLYLDNAIGGTPLCACCERNAIALRMTFAFCDATTLRGGWFCDALHLAEQNGLVCARR